MRSVLRRSILNLTFVGAVFALLGARPASAQNATGGTIGLGTGGTVGTTSLAASDFTIFYEKYDGKNWVQLNSVDQQYFFNQARCQCDQDPMGEFKIVIQPAAGAGQKVQTLLEANLTGGQGVGRLFAGAVGVDCLTASNPVYGGSLAGYCTNLLDPGNYPGFSFGMALFGNVNVYESPPIPVAYLFNSLTSACTNSCDSTALCSTMNTQTNIQFWAQTNSGLGPDFDPGPTATVSLVGYVPVTPTDVVADSGNGVLQVSWDWGGVNIATDTTLSGVQIFCQGSAGTQIFPTGSFGAAYQTPATLCPNNTKAVTAAAQVGGPFSNFDPKYLCSGLIPAASTSYRITGLQNGTIYSVGVAAVDKFGNIGANSKVAYAVPGAGTGGTGGASGTGGAGGAVRGPDAGLIGTGGIVGAGGSAGDPDAEATGGAFGSGGAVGVSPPDGAAGVADAGTGVRLANGCSCDIRARHERIETAGILWLALVILAFALKSVRYRPRVVGSRQPTE